MKKFLESLQGTWNVVALEIEGRKLAASAFQGSRIVVKGDTFDTMSMGATYRGKLKIDSRASPATLDLLFEEGPEKGNKSLGIFELDGDTWRLCLTLTEKTRPTAFATKPGSGLALETLKRQPEGSAHPTIRSEIDRLQGDWSFVSGEIDGHPLPAEMAKVGKRVTRENEVTVTFGGQVFLKAAFSLDPSRDPKAIDYILTHGPNLGEMQHGIYELKGDTATFCMAAPGRPRSTSFEPAAGDGAALTVWQRKKK